MAPGTFTAAHAQAPAVAEQPPRAAAVADIAKRELDRSHVALARALRVSDDLKVDDELRVSARALVDQALPGMRRIFTQWLADERQRQPAGTLDDHLFAVNARIDNELALWQLDSAGLEHDQRQQQAFAQPRACEGREKALTFMDTLVQAWQQVPGPQRAAFLAAEGELLRRWGTERGIAPARPVPSTDETAWHSIDQFIADGTAVPTALPPVLAWRLLSASSTPDVRRDESILCVLRQWSLKVALQQGRGRLTEAEWLAHRYARMPTALTWWGSGTPNDVNPADGYPRLASRLQVEGDITVAVTVDAQGRLIRSAVANRNVTVPGVRSQRPVAFETLLDDASLERAAALPPYKPRAEQLQDGLFTRKLNFKFKLQ